MPNNNSTPKQPLLAGVAQLTSTDNLDDNVENALKAMKGLRGCHIICFPENTLYLRLSKQAGDEPKALDLKEDFWWQFREFAVQNKTHIFLGSIPMKSAGKPTNSTIWVSPTGELVKAYDKIHLFDVDVKGAPPVRESDTFSAGNSPRMIEVNGWRIGLSICYDLRFAELYSYYADHEADLILVPSSFLVPTGEAHWHTLLRARAIESQAYVIAAAQSGGHENSRGQRRDTFGHSLVVDPWGEVLVDIEESGAAEVAVELDPSRLAKVREQIPQYSHRRLNTRSRT